MSVKQASGPQTTPSEKTLRRIVEDILGAAEEMKTWMTAKQAASYLSMSENEFRKFVREEDIHEYRISERRVRFLRSDLDDWMHTR